MMTIVLFYIFDNSSLQTITSLNMYMKNRWIYRFSRFCFAAIFRTQAEKYI